MGKRNILPACLLLILAFSVQALAQEAGVARSVFTSEIVDREPVDELDSVSTAVKKVFYFTELKGMGGQTITHRWLHNGDTKAEQSFNVGGSRWRVYSSKNLVADWVGDWTVQVLDSSGTVVREEGFVYFAGTDMGASTTEPQTMSTETGTTSQTAAASEHIKRATFTSDIQDREPIDEISSLSTDVNKVFFFTEIQGMEGTTVTHRWMYGGESKSEVSFQVGGPRWRVYSSKILLSGWVGTWTVQVVDVDGNLLREESFEYESATANK